MKDLQQGLFKYKLKQLCREVNCNLKDLRLLIKKDLLSFALNKKEYEIYEVDEARFLTSLLKSEIPIKTIKGMLFNLEKPFAYTNLSYDFTKKAWIEKSIGPDEDIAIIGDYIGDYIEYLEEEDDREKISEIFNLLKEKVEA